MKQWTRFYPDGAIGQVVCPDSPATFLFVVWPPTGPMGGVERVGVASTLDDATKRADHIAGQPSRLSDWSEKATEGQ
jgi:hypothetical protein